MQSNSSKFARRYDREFKQQAVGASMAAMLWSMAVKAGALAAASSGSAIESAARVLSSAALGRSIQFFSKVQSRLRAIAAGVGA